MPISNKLSSKRSLIKTEVALKESEKMLKEAEHVAGIGSWIWDIKHNKILWSEELYRIRGLNRKIPLLTYEKLRRFYTKESWKKLSYAVKKAVSKGTPYKLELDIVRPDGQIRHTLATGRAEKDKSNKVFCLYGTIQDITERKKEASVLKESENKFKTLFEGSNDAIFIADIATRKLIDCNKKAVNLIGYPKHKLIGMSVWSMFPKDIVKKAIAGFIRHASGKNEFIKLEVLTKDKKRVPVEISSKPIKISGRSYLQGIFRDITERKKTEGALQKYKEHLEDKVKERTELLSKSEDKFRKIFNASSDGILVVDKKRNISDINKRVEKILGFSKKYLVGKNILFLHERKDFKKCKSNISKAFSGKQVMCDCSYMGLNKIISAETVLTKMTFSQP